MKKQIKTLVAAGLITAVSAGNMLTSHANSRVDLCKIKYVPISKLICINSEEKLNIFTPNWDCKASIPECTEDDNTIVPETKPETNTDDNNTVVPETKPETNTDDNNTVVPETKPETNTDEDNTVVPETKPENNTDDNNTAKPETDNSFAAYQQEVLNLVNEERAKVGANPLSLNAELSSVATVKSQDMIDKNYFDHNSPTYGSPFDMMGQFGVSYRSAGENIAYGQMSPEEVMNSWMSSPGHRKNILSTDFNELGVGIAKASNGQLYWTQMFIGN